MPWLWIPGYHKTLKLIVAYSTSICIYVSSRLNSHEHELEDTMNYKESVWVIINLNGSDRLLCGCIYRSPVSNDTNNDNLRSLINKMANIQSSHKLLLGDFNFPHINWTTWTTALGNNSATYKFIDCLQNNTKCTNTWMNQHASEKAKDQIF